MDAPPYARDCAHSPMGFLAGHGPAGGRLRGRAGRQGNGRRRGVGCRVVRTRDASTAPSSGALAATDGRTTTVATKVDVGGNPCGVALAGGTLWVTDNKAARLVKVNAGGFVEEGGFLWVGDDTTGATSILRVDPKTWKTTPVPSGGDRPGYLATTPGRVWVSNVRSGTVAGIDTTTLAPVGPPAAAGASPVNLKASADGAWVWVPDDQGDLVTRIDAASGEAVERLRGGGPGSGCPRP